MKFSNMLRVARIISDPEVFAIFSRLLVYINKFVISNLYPANN